MANLVKVGGKLGGEGRLAGSWEGRVGWHTWREDPGILASVPRATPGQATPGHLATQGSWEYRDLEYLGSRITGIPGSWVNMDPEIHPM